MKERIILLIRALNFTSAQFADEIGVQKSGISHIISGRNNPSLDFVQKILQRFPEVNMEWLIMGKGSMIKGDIARNPEPDILSTYTAPAGNNLSLDLFSEQISHPLEVKIPEKSTEMLVEPGFPPSEKTVEIPTQFQQIDIDEEPESREIKKATLSKPTEVANEKKVERILFFYSDKTFKEYHPES